MMHIQHHSDQIPFLSKNMGAGAHQPHAWATTSHCKSDIPGETWRRASHAEPVTARPPQEGPQRTKGERQGNTRTTAAVSAGT